MFFTGREGGLFFSSVSKIARDSLCLHGVRYKKRPKKRKRKTTAGWATYSHTMKPQRCFDGEQKESKLCDSSKRLSFFFFFFVLSVWWKSTTFFQILITFWFYSTILLTPTELSLDFFLERFLVIGPV